jgi:uncharacterized protein DUF1844
MSTENQDKPQIFVDEDWKSRVEAEKKNAAGASATGSSATAATDDRAGAEPPPPLPPATLSFLVTTLATQAMVSLGQVPNPFSGKVEVRLPEARHFIDTLVMLEEKTAGNRTPEESALLRGALHQLRMAYIEAEATPAPSPQSVSK